MKWEYKDLQKWIENGCNPEIGSNVLILDISGNQIKRLPEEIFQLSNLQVFYCSYNEILELPRQIGQLVNLQEFNCFHNEILKLPEEIYKLVKLEMFNCGYNYLKELPKEIYKLVNLLRFYCGVNQISELPKEIGSLVNLQKFDCVHNHISKLPREIGNLIKLEFFECSYNKISELPKEIGHLVNLQTFECSYNKISELPREIGQLVNLQGFHCYSNKIKTLPIEITNCRNLIDFRFSNNEIEYIPPQVQRWLKRYETMQQIYNDRQSVHNHNIQEGIRNSINYLMQIKPTLSFEDLRSNIINNSKLQCKEILLEYCDDKNIHSVLNITFEELLLSVYDFILKHKFKDELFKILDKEMSDSLCKCFTGRISRLVNVLNGYDENIKINISQAEQIGNIFIIVRNRLEKEDRYTDELFKEIVIQELREREYDETIINEWLSNI